MKDALVSILVAVYNAEAFLGQCLDSLLGQTHRELEIICVDDASTDGSWQILRKYAAKDGRIVTIHLDENRGQAHARNRGLERAGGAFITMVDADDWLAPDALERTLEVFTRHPQSDCVLFDLVYHEQESGGEHRFELPQGCEVLTGREAMGLSLDWHIHGLYLVRADLHKRYPYDETCRLYSDDNTTHLHFLHSQEVRFSEGRYFYRQHGGSCTGAVTAKRFLHLTASRHMREMLDAEGVSEEVINRYEQHRWRILTGLCQFYLENRSRLSEEDTSIRTLLRTSHRNMEFNRLRWSDNGHPIYWPVRNWWLFAVNQRLCFLIRQLKHLFS